MSNIYVFSGPCGCGKSTLADAYAHYLVESCGKLQVYVIHGDDFHRGFVETAQRVGHECPNFLYWADILRFNWESMLTVAQIALNKNLDVIIDYVVENELSMLKELASNNHARLFYVVLTASLGELTQRLLQRGSSHLIERSHFLKAKLDDAPEHQKYLYNISGKTVEQEIADLDITKYEIILP